MNELKPPYDTDGDAAVEQLLRDALDAEARTAVPDHRRPPAMEWPKEQKARPWITPLAVAASVVAIAGGAGAVVLAQRPDTTLPPTSRTETDAPTPSVTTPPPTAPPTTAQSTTPPPSTPPTTAGSPTSVSVGGATLVVPGGWSIRRDTGTANSTPINDTWCLDPTGSTACTISFVRLDPTRNDLDSDLEGGLEANPAYCPAADGAQTRTLVDYAEPTWGGRAAELRYWRTVCGDGSTHDVAQYTVMTPTAYLLLSEKATTEVRSTMASVVGSSTLPAATSSTRLYDYGVLRSAVRQPDGSTVVEIDRVVKGRPNTNPATYRYVVPATVPEAQNLPSYVRTPIGLHTDGQVVTSYTVGG